MKWSRCRLNPVQAESCRCLHVPRAFLYQSSSRKTKNSLNPAEEVCSCRMSVREKSWQWLTHDPSAGQKCYACIVSKEEKPELDSALQVCVRLHLLHTEVYRKYGGNQVGATLGLHCWCLSSRKKHVSHRLGCHLVTVCVCVCCCRRWDWRSATQRRDASSQPTSLTSVGWCLSVSNSLDQTTRDWWRRSSGLLVGVNAVCLGCTITCTAMAFVCVCDECTAECVGPQPVAVH